MLTRIDHIGIACFDLDRTAGFYRTVLGLEVTHVETNDEQGIREAVLKVNDTPDGGMSYIQLLQPIRQDSAVAKWLAKNGEGIHHIAFGTDDVDGMSEDIRGEGVRVLYDTPRSGTRNSRINFLHPKDCGNALLELVTAAAPAEPVTTTD